MSHIAWLVTHFLPRLAGCRHSTAPPPFLLHPRQYACFVHLHFVFFLHSVFPHPPILPSPSSSTPFSVQLFPPPIHSSLLSCPPLFTSFNCTNQRFHKFSL